MKIHTRIVFDIASGLVVEDECFEYSGPVALCDGGPGAGEGGYGTGSPGQGEGVVSDSSNSGSGGATGDSSGGSSGSSGGASAGDSGGISEGWGPPEAYTGEPGTPSAPGSFSFGPPSPEQEGMVNNARDMGYFDSPFGPPENITENAYDIGYLESAFDTGRGMVDNAQSYAEFGIPALDARDFNAPVGFWENTKDIAGKAGKFAVNAALGVYSPDRGFVTSPLFNALFEDPPPARMAVDLAKSYPESKLSRSVNEMEALSKMNYGEKVARGISQNVVTTPLSIGLRAAGVPGTLSALATRGVSGKIGEAFDTAKENENQSTVRGGVLDDIANTLADKSNPNLENAIAAAQGRPSPVEEYSPFSYPQDFWQR